MRRLLPLATAVLLACSTGPTEPFPVPATLLPESSADAPVEIPVSKYTTPPKLVTFTLHDSGAIPVFASPALSLAETVENTSSLNDSLVATFLTTNLAPFTEVAPDQIKPLQVSIDARTWRWASGEFVVKLPLEIRYLWAHQADGEPDPGTDEVPESVPSRTDIYVKFTLDCDLDGDGVDSTQCGGRDCDDTTSAVHPGADETCNGIDDDCDGAKDEGAVDTHVYYADMDKDGWGDPLDTVDACARPTGFSAQDGDCNDDDDRIHPGAPEACSDHVDNDCDGFTDGADPDCR